MNYFDLGLPYGVIASDNECSSSFLAALLAGEDLTSRSMHECLKAGMIVIGLANNRTTLQTRAALARLGIPFRMNNHPRRLALQGLKVCHIADAAGDLSAIGIPALEQEMQIRIFRTLSPVNLAPFPVQKLFAALISRRISQNGGQDVVDTWFANARPPFSPEELKEFPDQYRPAGPHPWPG